MRSTSIWGEWPSYPRKANLIQVRLVGEIFLSATAKNQIHLFGRGETFRPLRDNGGVGHLDADTRRPHSGRRFERRAKPAIACSRGPHPAVDQKCYGDTRLLRSPFV